MQHGQGGIAHGDAARVQFRAAGEHQVALDDGIADKRQRGRHDVGLGRRDNAEHQRGESIAGVKIDEVGGEVVDEADAGLHREDLQGGRGGERQPMRHPEGEEQLGHQRIDRQHVDEPEHAVRLDDGHEGLADDRADVARAQADLEDDLQHGPERVEVEIVDDAAVGIGGPRTGNDGAEEQAGDQEELRHAERGGPADDVVEDAGAVQVFADAIGGVHHHHEDDREAFGGIYPIEAVGCSRHFSGAPGARPARFSASGHIWGAMPALRLKPSA